MNCLFFHLVLYIIPVVLYNFITVASITCWWIKVAQNYKIAISPAGKIGSTPNFNVVIEPHKWLRGWPEWNSRWRTAAILQNVGNAITRLSVDRFGWNLGGRIPSRSRHVHRDAVAMATADRRCLATAHWTFSSHGRLETECVNQFWWNLVHNSKLGPQWQSRNQILFFLI